MKLTPKQRAFAAAYVKDTGRNGTAAARTAGYGTPRVRAQGLLKNPLVLGLIAKLEAAARKRLKISKHVDVEVLPPAVPLECPQSALTLHQEQQAIGARAEVLAMATNIVRANESRRVGDLFHDAGDSLLMDPAKVRELPLSMVGGLSHDHAGDLELKLRDPLQAGKILLDDHYRQRGDEDPMERPRHVTNILMFQGSAKDRAAFDAMARRLAEIAPNGEPGGNGDG